MSEVATQTPLSRADYARMEGRAAGKHEYLAGEVFAMAGGSPEHGAIAIAINIASSSIAACRTRTLLEARPGERLHLHALDLHPSADDVYRNPLQNDA